MSPLPAMTSRSRFHAVINGQPVDRLPMVEWALWWDKTLERWFGEGLPVIPNGQTFDYHRYFGLDVWRQDWIEPHSGMPAPAHHGAPIINDMDGYRALKPTLYGPVRAGGGPWPGWKQGLAGGDLGWFTIPGFFWWPRTLLGIENHLYALADDHELIHAINSDLADWLIRTVDDLLPHARPDFMTFAEDLSYNHGPMLSQRCFDAVLLPYYQRVIPALRERGIRVIVDSDGDVTRCLPWFERAGFEGILPLERQAGVDIDKLQAAHPRTLLVGHFDKMTMPHGEAAMRGEFERLLPAMRRGRFIPSVDHQTPPGVSLENYRIYLRLLSEYARRAAA